MQFKSLIYNFWPRLFIGFIGGLAFRLPVDVIIGLSYKNYTVDYFIAYYLLSCLSSMVLFQVFHILNQLLDKCCAIQNKTSKRFWLQLLAQSVTGLIILLSIRYLFNFFVLKQNFYVINFEILNVVVIISALIIYNLAELGYYLVNNSRYSLAELERFKKENAEFRFETLVNQVNPHFLFNSLNTLSSLLYEDRDMAAKYIRELARVYRYVLENKEYGLVTLKVDLEFVNAYIYLLELRFKDMLSFKMDVEENDMDKMIAPMTIQMLIENAVKHNIISKKKHLEIGIFSHNDHLIVSNKIQKKQVKDYSAGIGLSNIISRYIYLTDREVEVKETNEDFIVKIPLLTQYENRQHN